jgi:acetyl esterase
MKRRNFGQRVLRWIARVLIGLPDWLIRWLVGKPIEREGRMLDLQVQLMLALVRATRAKPWYEMSLPHARRQLEAEAGFLTPAMPPLAGIENILLTGPAGPISARLYRPAGLSQSAPALVFYHGGGFVLGSIDSHDPPCRWIAAHVGCVVISVDYRLAPEHPFPAGVDDAIAAFRALAGGCDSLGLDPARLAVGGDSAGGNLAAVVAQQTRSDAIRPCFQLLIYPATDMPMSFPSIRTFGSGYLLQKASMDWFIASYLPAGQDKLDPRCSPLYGDVAGLPPALVQTAGFDPLCDEGEAYAKKMRDAGVAVEQRRYAGLIHGYLNTSGTVRAARVAMDDIVASLRVGFGIPAAPTRS